MNPSESPMDPFGGSRNQPSRNPVHAFLQEAHESDDPQTKEAAEILMRRYLQQRVERVRSAIAKSNNAQSEAAERREQVCAALIELGHFLHHAKARGIEAWDEVRTRIEQFQASFPDFACDTGLPTTAGIYYMASDNSWRVFVTSTAFEGRYAIRVSPPKGA